MSGEATRADPRLMRALGNIEGAIGGLSEKLTTAMATNSAEHRDLHDRITRQAERLREVERDQAVQAGGRGKSKALTGAVLTLSGGSFGAVLVKLWDRLSGAGG